MNMSLYVKCLIKMLMRRKMSLFYIYKINFSSKNKKMNLNLIDRKTRTVLF